MRNLRRKMDTPTVVLSISSANFMDTLQPADSSIFKAPCDVHFFILRVAAAAPSTGRPMPTPSVVPSGAR
jgi:hypothetical protein